MYFIDIPESDLLRAIESWKWITFPRYSSYKVTAFGDIFFHCEDGSIAFLDTLEGKLSTPFNNNESFNIALSETTFLDHYCFAGFIERATRDGITLTDGECYDWKLNPVVGGEISYNNITKMNFVVAINIAGQLHEQTKDPPPGTRISAFKTIE